MIFFNETSKLISTLSKYNGSVDIDFDYSDYGVTITAEVPCPGKDTFYILKDEISFGRFSRYGTYSERMGCNFEVYASRIVYRMLKMYEHTFKTNHNINVL